MQSGGGDQQQQQQQNHRMKDMKGGLQQLSQQQQQQQAAQQQQQKCPRCDSINTKFCYYNNYSLTQPRYFCKTCRRYWTQGGTLRNVPVGGGCRKGKRSKKPSSSASSSSTTTTTSTTDHHHHINQQSPSLAMPHHQNFGLMGKGIEGMSPSSPFLMAPAATAAMAAAPLYYPSGGFLSSLAAFQSINNQLGLMGSSTSVGGDHHHHQFGGSNLALLQGFSSTIPSFVTQQQQQQVFNLEDSMIEASNRPSNEDWSTHDQGFNRNGSDGDHDLHEQQWGSSSTATNPTKGTTMATSTTATTTTSSAAVGGGTDHPTSGGPSVNPITHHWSDHLPGFGPPPTTSTSSSLPFL